MSFRYEYCGKLLTGNNFWACYAFETARDLLLKRKPRVIKILTNAGLHQLSKLFPEIEFRKKCDEHAYFVHEDYSVRFFTIDYLAEPLDKNRAETGVQKKALKMAAEYSPFTINSFFYDFERDIFHDPLDAYSMLKGRVIKTINSPERTAETFPTIVLKTAKVVSETGFKVDKTLQRFLKKNETLYNYREIDENIAGDFLDICVSGRAYEALSLLDECGVLEMLLPEVTLLKTVNQDKEYHPEGNGFRHTLECLKCVKKPNKTLMMSILLHDTGKAITAAGGKNKKPFPNHSYVSKTIAKKVLCRFYYNNEEMDEVFFLVKNHMILDAVDRLPENRLRSLFSSPYFSNLLELYRADLESGYHNIDSYYLAARVYREFLRKDKLRRQGVYV